MSTPPSDDADSRSNAWRRALQNVPAWLGAAWRANPGYTIAAVSGLLGLLLAIWLLISAGLGWQVPSRPVASTELAQVAQPAHWVLPMNPDSSDSDPPKPGEIRQVAGRLPAPLRRQGLPRAPLDLDFEGELPVAPQEALKTPARFPNEPVEDLPADEEPTEVSRFNRATSDLAGASRKEVDSTGSDVESDPTAGIIAEATDFERTADDDASFADVGRAPPEAAGANPDFDIESEPSVDIDAELPQVADNLPPPGEVNSPSQVIDPRLSEPALEPEFAADTEMAWLVPAAPVVLAERDSAESPNPSQLEPDPADWKSAPPLSSREPAKTSTQSAPVHTRILLAESFEDERSTNAGVGSKENESGGARNEQFVPRRSAKLRLQWESDDVAEAGRIAKILLLVTNIGDTAARDVRLSLRLPAEVGHPEGQDLEQNLGRLNAGETRRIPLIIRPVKAGEVELPVTAQTGAVTTSSTGVITVANTKSDR